MKNGFSLVELSIVLVILGLLTGGILAGQSLIRAAELRSVVTERDRYFTTINTFRDKYFALPGDMANATSFWGDQATGTSACASAATPDGTPGTCNGNGDGFWTAGQAGSGEGLRAWQQLAMAGLIEGSYTGFLDGGTDLTIGTNVPKSKAGNGGWALMQRSGAGNEIFGTVGNYLYLGAKTGTFLFNPILKPEETWNIDTKTDDGKPHTGNMMGGGNCVTPTLSDNSIPTPGVTYDYSLSTNTVSCRIWFKWQ